MIPKGTVLEISEHGTKRPSFMNQAWSRFYRSEMDTQNSVSIVCSEHSTAWVQLTNPVTVLRVVNTFQRAISLD